MSKLLSTNEALINRHIGKDNALYECVTELKDLHQKLAEKTYEGKRSTLIQAITDLEGILAEKIKIIQDWEREQEIFTQEESVNGEMVENNEDSQLFYGNTFDTVYQVAMAHVDDEYISLCLDNIVKFKRNSQAWKNEVLNLTARLYNTGLLVNETQKIEAELDEMRAEVGHEQYERFQHNTSQEITENQLEATDQMAYYDSPEFQEKAKEERDQLLAMNYQIDENKKRAEAHIYKLIGMSQAQEITENFNKALRAKTFMEVRESKSYKGLEVISVDGEKIKLNTWEDFCKSAGVSKTHINTDIENLKTFGEKFMLASESLGLGYRDLRRLRSGIREVGLSQEEKLALEEAKKKSPEELLLMLEEIQDRQKAQEEKIEELEAQNNTKGELIAHKSSEIDKLHLEIEKKETRSAKDKELDALLEAQNALGAKITLLFADYNDACKVVFSKELDDNRLAIANKEVAATFEKIGILLMAHHHSSINYLDIFDSLGATYNPNIDYSA